MSESEARNEEEMFRASSEVPGAGISHTDISHI
jgi:hypothetical protein